MVEHKVVVESLHALSNMAHWSTSWNLGGEADWRLVHTLPFGKDQVIFMLERFV